MSEIHELPLVTFVLFAYNQETFICEAVQAALSQDYQRLEIILSDDCSTDSTFEIINSIASEYSGPHKLIINRNTVNLGLAKHFSELVVRSQGEIIVVAAGDDISLVNRVSRTVEMFCSDPEVNFASFTDTVINENGIIQHRFRGSTEKKIRRVTLDDYIEGRTPPLSGASRGYRKKVFEIFGGLNAECPTEDTPSILRSLMFGHALVSSESGILYRQHGKNLSGLAFIHEMKFYEIKKQYMHDTKIAHDAGLITENTMLSINEWADRNLRKRILAKEFHSTPSKINFFLNKIITSKDFNLREKIGIFLRIFRLRRFS